MKDILKMVFVLACICVLAGALLAVIDSVTREPIAAAMREEKMKAMRRVLPGYDNDPMACTNVVVENGDAWVFHVARKDGEFAGAAFEAASGEGYGGTVRIMIGAGADDAVLGLEILQHAETPGLGARITESGFRNQFRDRSIGDTVWTVKSDGGDIDAVTGATMSSRAVLDALRRGLDVYIRNREEVAASGAE